MKTVPIPQFNGIHDELKKTFNSRKTMPLEYRKQQLAQVAYMVQENAEAFKKAIHQDMRKPYLESTVAELGPVVGQAVRAIQNLEKWTADEHVPDDEVDPFHKGWDLKTVRVPRGVVLIIGPWNYPMILTLGPLVGAIAAGCCAVIKPSEVAPHFAELLLDLLPKYVDDSAYRVITGSVPEITALLDLQWDMIFYTGNERVGSIVAKAAAKYVTPCTLELGSKCPAIIDDKITPEDLKIAVRRIAWGKTQNAGQVCVSPDYVVVPKTIHHEFIKLYKAAIESFFPDGADKSESYARIINESHFKRISDLIGRTKGDIALGGKSAAKDDGFFIEPTLVTDVKRDDALMEDELFAPVLPVITVEDLDDAISFVNGVPSALSVYLFSTSDESKKKVTERTRSGQVVFNETFGQLGVYELPFGGLGPSGYGTQMGRHTFEGFTKQKGSIDVPLGLEPMLGFRYPPYTQQGADFFNQMYQLPIPIPKQSAAGAVVEDITDKIKHVMAL
ncbi:hypothetical protein FS837_010026 [Tulasnella sp. UAMH 9824]|nr:hypothetical protein FS837_010026 [Tulasnella sp. UAMH 9824]